MQISSGMSRSRRWRISAGSRAAAMPWPMRSAPIASAAQMDSGRWCPRRRAPSGAGRPRGECEDVREPLRRPARFAAADADGHHAAIHALGRQLRHAIAGSTPNWRMASRIQRTSTASRARHRGWRRKSARIPALPKHHAGRDDDLGVLHVLRGQPFEQAARDQRVVLGRAQRLPTGAKAFRNASKSA
jgi:hypothetical protein